MRALTPLPLLTTLALFSLLPACASPSWKSSYKPLTQQGELLASSSAKDAPRTSLPPTTRVDLKRVPLDEVSIGAIPTDCTPLGFSEYQRTSPGGLEDESRLIDFARALGATRVLWGSGFSHRTSSTEYETAAGPRTWDRYPSSPGSGSQLYSVPVTRIDEWYTLRALFLRETQPK